MARKIPIIVSMKGTICTKQKCPTCDGGFKDTGGSLVCPICHTHPSSYYVYVYFNRREKDGGAAERKRFYSNPNTGQPFSNYQQALQFVGHLRYEVSQGTFNHRNYSKQVIEERKFRTYAQVWLGRQEHSLDAGNKAYNTLKNLRGTFKNYLLPFFGEDDIQIRQTRIYAFYNEILGQTELAPKTKKNILDDLKNILHSAWDEFDIQTSFPKFPKIDVPLDNNWTLIDLETQDRIIYAIEDPVVQAAILFSARQMARPSEVRALQAGDVVFNEHAVRITRTFSGNRLKKTTKTRRSRWLPLDPEVEERLRGLCEAKPPEAFVFSFDGGTSPIGQNVMRRTWGRVSESLGVNGIKLYPGTRHSSATERLRSGVQERKIQIMLGHTTSKMTQRYAKVLTEDLKDVIRDDIRDRYQDSDGRRNIEL